MRSLEACISSAGGTARQGLCVDEVPKAQSKDQHNLPLRVAPRSYGKKLQKACDTVPTDFTARRCKFPWLRQHVCKFPWLRQHVLTDLQLLQPPPPPLLLLVDDVNGMPHRGRHPVHPMRCSHFKASIFCIR